jgi:hypothetical protein
MCVYEKTNSYIKLLRNTPLSLSYYAQNKEKTVQDIFNIAYNKLELNPIKLLGARVHRWSLKKTNLTRKHKTW